FSSRRRHTRCYRDWSSDVCSSDLHVEAGSNGDITGKLALIEPIGSVTHYYIEWPNAFGGSLVASVSHGAAGLAALNTLKLGDTEIGRASCRERGEIAGGRVGVKK